MKFLVDMALSPQLAAWLGSQGHDAMHASQFSLDRAPDYEILRRASLEGRVVVTADLDFPRLLATLNASGPGLILLRGGNYSEREALNCVMRVLKAIPENELPQSIVVVDQHRVRRRSLPI
jgi:predicted nuclease of predicted toxin-antitoxin system